MRGKETVTGVVETARPYAERIARDEDLHDHVKSAYASARKIYDELVTSSGTGAIAARVAQDKTVQNEVKKAIQELREAGKRVQGKESHRTRNASLLLTGIAIGILFNPATGPETRRWLKDRMFGAEEPFEYQGNGA
jgi:hypothetical protein